LPIAGFFYLSIFLSKWVNDSFGYSTIITVRVMMIFFTFLVFLFVIPYIRKRENISGIRSALVGFIIVALVMALPYLIFRKDISVLLSQLTYLGSYILLTFIFSPEVLGMDVDLRSYFKHFKQLIVLGVYLSIILCYVLGFATIYHSMHQENPQSFDMEGGGSYVTFAYFSAITFTTIGYGDISPLSLGARFVVSIQAIMGTVINVIFIAILFIYISNFENWFQKEEEELEKQTKAIRQIRKKLKDKN